MQVCSNEGMSPSKGDNFKIVEIGCYLEMHHITKEIEIGGRFKFDKIMVP
jgi:hypothetical protein